MPCKGLNLYSVTISTVKNLKIIGLTRDLGFNDAIKGFKFQLGDHTTITK